MHTAPHMPFRTDDGRTITSDGLARLLARLDADREQAALEYERLRQTLVKFFDWRRLWPADEAADEVVDRLARRLLENEPIEDVRRYAHGIARLVLLERRRAPAAISLDGAPELPAVPEPDWSDDGPRRDCFDRCLAEMPADGRSLVMEYYEGQGAAKISNRRRLAGRFGLSDNALRSRVQRLRDRLERCVHACVSGAR